MTLRHRVTADELDALASDDDDTDAVQTLRLSLYSRRALLLRGLLDEATRRHPEACEAADIEGAFRVLTQVQERSPKVFDEVLLHPHVGGWIAACLRRLGADCPSDSLRPIEIDLAHLGAIAASAAIRAGEAFSVRVPLHDGKLALPLRGSTWMRTTSPFAVAVLRTTQRALVIDCDGSHARFSTDLAEDHRGWQTIRLRSLRWRSLRPAALRRSIEWRSLRRRAVEWRAARRLHATAKTQVILDVVLDDTDPYRLYHGLTPAELLSGETVERWRSTLDRAWTLLDEHHRMLANSIAAGLSSIVPLAGPIANVSGTSSDAFGAAAVSLPTSHTCLAVALVHEFQHSKLGALLDLVPLLSEKTDPTFYAPWRDDPRPLEGLLQGCYAFFAIAGFWRVQREVAEDDADLAQFEFALWREAVLETTGTILRSGRLTTPGHRFVTHMRQTAATWCEEQVPDRPRAAARLASLDHRLTWRLRNLVPDPDRVDALAQLWAANRPCPDRDPVPVFVIPGAFVPGDTVRRRLLRQVISQPNERPPEEVTAADLSLAAGDYSLAAARYQAQIETDPTCATSWAGYALATAADRAGPSTLGRNPELLLAVHSAIQHTTSTAPGLDRLSSWLAPLLDRAPWTSILLSRCS